MNNTVTTYPRPKRRRTDAGKKAANGKKAATGRKAAPGKKAAPERRRNAYQGAQHPEGLRLPDWAGGDGSELYTLPGWEDVNAGPKKKKNRKTAPKKAREKHSNLEEVSTRTFAMYTFIAVLLLGLYVSHVFGTQSTLENLEQLQQENFRLTLEYDQKKARFENLVSPDEVYRRAKELGFQPGTEFGAPVLIKEDK